MTIQKVVDEYIKCGKKFGFLIAECILGKYTPHMLEGKCYSVPVKNRKKFVEHLKRGKI